MRPCAAVVALALASLAPAAAPAQVTRSDVFVVEDTDGSIMEAAGAPDTYLAKIACAMRQQHPGSDLFDAMFVFSGIPLAGPFNVQQGWPVMQVSTGIGRTKYNNSKNFCSINRLRQAVKMGDLSRLPDDPDKPYRGDILMLGYALSGIELMAHEFGHQWLAAITFDKGDGTGRHCIARAWAGTSETPPTSGELCDGWSPFDYNQHWSYLYNSRSVMYGNMIDDLGGGRFRFWYDQPRFSEMDQYVMGLRGPDEVPPQFIVLKDDQALSPQSPTASEWILEGGSRMDFTATDVVRAEGERIPVREPCHWKGALVFVWSRTAGGLGPGPTVLDKVVRYGNRWEEWYDWGTDHRGSFDVTRDNRGRGTETCPDPRQPWTADPGGGPDEALPDAGTPDVPVPEAGDAGTRPDAIPGDPGPAQDPGGPASDAAPAADLPAGDRPAPVDAPAADGAGGTCAPGARTCNGNQVLQCDAEGRAWAFVRSCATEGLACEGDGLCVPAAGPKGGGCAAGPGGTIAPAWLLLLLALARGLTRRPARW